MEYSKLEKDRLISSLKGRPFEKAWQKLWLRFTVVFIVRCYGLHWICVFSGSIKILSQKVSLSTYIYIRIKCNRKTCTGEGEEFPQIHPSHQFQGCSFDIIKSIARLFSWVNSQFLFHSIKHISLSGQYKNIPVMTITGYTRVGYYVNRELIWREIIPT